VRRNALESVPVPDSRQRWRAQRRLAEAPAAELRWPAPAIATARTPSISTSMQSRDVVASVAVAAHRPLAGGLFHIDA